MKMIKLKYLFNRNEKGKVTQITYWMNDEGIFIGTMLYHFSIGYIFIEDRINDKLPLVKCPIYPCVLVTENIVNEKMHFSCGDGLIETCVWNE